MISEDELKEMREACKHKGSTYFTEHPQFQYEVMACKNFERLLDEVMRLKKELASKISFNPQLMGKDLTEFEQLKKDQQIHCQQKRSLEKARDEWKARAEKLAQQIQKALPRTPSMDGTDSWNQAQRIIDRALADYRASMKGEK